MEKNACGVISYAGLSREALLAQAKAAFAQAQPPVPARFDAFLPLFPVELVQNMDYVGAVESRGAKVAPSGFSIDPIEYHRKLYTQLPELYAGENYARNFDYEGHFSGRGVFAVDAVWVEHFPQYQPFLGEKLALYLIGGGSQAVAVPESVYPRGGGVLSAAEQAMQVTQRADMYAQYARTRVSGGDAYDPDAYAGEYLRVAGLAPVCFTQAELGRILQDLSIVKGLQNEGASVGLYTENARRAERVNQYVPMRYACDLFTGEAVDKHTARLAQLCHTDSDYVSDLWIPYQDFCAYMDRARGTLDVRALCEGYQIAPAYDAETGGGRYPDAVRVAVVRDRDLPLMAGEVINNPAYGNGMGPRGILGRQVYIADSREMIRQRKLTLETMAVTSENTALPPEEYRRSLALAILQEHKGRLVDAMYRRETALRQIDPDAPVYEKARQLLNERVERLEAVVNKEAAQSGMSQMSGYDADIDYLRRMGLDREGEPEETRGRKPVPFAHDAQREQSIESGYAMRAGLTRMMYTDAALPEPPAGSSVGADDSEDSETREPLPPLPVSEHAARPTPLAEVKPVPPEADEVPLAEPPMTTTAPETANASTVGSATQMRTLVRESIPERRAATVAEPATEMDAANESLAANPAVTADAVSAPGAPPVDERPTGAAAEVASVAGEASATDNVLEHPEAGAPLQETDLENVTPIAFAPADLPIPQGASPEPLPRTDAPEPPPTAAVGDAADPEATAATAEGENGVEGATDNMPPAPGDATGSHPRVSLKELTERGAAGAEPDAGAEPAPEEAPKPKLAYILHRGSESVANQSYKRMADLLHKREP